MLWCDLKIISFLDVIHGSPLVRHISVHRKCWRDKINKIQIQIYVWVFRFGKQSIILVWFKSDLRIYFLRGPIFFEHFSTWTLLLRTTGIIRQEFFYFQLVINKSSCQHLRLDSDKYIKINTARFSVRDFHVKKHFTRTFSSNPDRYTDIL